MDLHLTPGLRLAEFELRSLLGRGGMGEVWEAVLNGPGGFQKPVALKLVRDVHDESARQALLREARVGGLLCHPNVVSTLSVSVHDGRWMVALERVQGRSLAELSRQHGPLPASSTPWTRASPGSPSCSRRSSRPIRRTAPLPPAPPPSSWARCGRGRPARGASAISSPAVPRLLPHRSTRARRGGSCRGTSAPPGTGSWGARRCSPRWRPGCSAPRPA